MIQNLKDIPRIGEKTTRRFIEHFAGEKQALEAIINRDIDAISEVEGMTEKSAISLILEAMCLTDGAGVRDFLRTGEAFELYQRILEMIKGFAHTDYARSRLNLYFPYPSQKKDKIIQLQKEIGSIIKLAAGIDDNELPPLLSKIKPLKKNFTMPLIRDRVIIASTAQEFEAAKNFPVQVQLAQNPGEVIDMARGYSHVILSTALAGMDFPEDIDVDFMDIKKAQMWQVAPENELYFFTKNLDSINCAIRVFKIIRQLAPDYCARIKNEEIERLCAGMEKLSVDSDIKKGLDSEIDRCKSILDKLDDVVINAERNANLEFTSLIENSSITVKGFDMLSAMDGGINRLLEKEIREKYTTVTANSLRGIAAEMGLNPTESQYVNNFFSYEVTHPIKVNRHAIDNLKNHLLRIISSRKLVHLRENARALSTLKETSLAIVREVLDFDLKYTIACFSMKFTLKMPVLSEKIGIGIEGGANIFLSEAIPINYTVGVSRLNSDIGKLKSARVVLLSGVNSGGKTSTLELLAQVVILAHMGFPVPAKKCELGLVEEFYYFGKSKGTMDAGAFESTIREFSAVANNKSKIVLTDEMESITEPGASAKIISGILEELDDNNGIGVFVSHLADSILKNTDHDIRVDGIEAKGLDENLNLIVDRNPRYNYLARSTPELIVERLSRKNKGNEFYERLLRKFR